MLEFALLPCYSPFEVITMKSNQIEAVKNRIEALRQRIKDGDYKDLNEKHELDKQRWLLKKQLTALEAGLDTFIAQ